jgi:hypothetical protein
VNKKLIGILICELLLVNISVVFGIPEEKIITNREGEYYVFEFSSGNRDIKYIEINDHSKSSLLKRIDKNTNDNLAPNPSFEEGDTKPTGWEHYSINVNGIFHWDSNYSHSGEKSIGCVNLTYKQNNLGELIWETTDFIPVDFGENDYEFSGWTKFIGTEISCNQSVTFWVVLYNESYHHLGRIGKYFEFFSEWRYVSMNTSFDFFNLKPYTKYVKLQLTQDNFHTYKQINPSIEVRFDDVFFGVFNTVPDTPTITGETNGSIATSYNYYFQTTDPDQDDVKYYVDWGDKSFTTTGLNISGKQIVVSHTWNTERIYSIKVKAIDRYDAESNWATLTVTMPYNYNKPIPQFLELLFQRFPNAFPLIRQLIG